MIHLIYILLYVIQAGAIPGRVLQACTLLDTQVYCYGGYQSASGGVFTNMKPDHLTINVTQLSPSNLPNWQPLTPPATGTRPEPRSAFSMAALDSHRYIMLGGGHGDALNTPAIIYDRNGNTWTALAEPPFYMSEGAMVSSDPNTVFAYGGKLNSTPNYTPSNLLKLDLTTVPGKWAVLPSGPGAPPISRYGHAMTIRNNIIYFFGGFLNLPETKLQPNIVPLFNVSWYNTLTDQWGTNMATGDNPAGRKYHTATLIGNTSSVLIYGGTGLANLQALPLLDYIYIYDLDEHKYTKVKPDGGGPGARIGHSAIFYQNKVIISFGYDGSGNILNDSHILDVSQPYTPSWINDNNNNNTNSTDPGSNRHSTSLATGAVVGIVIGVVAIVAIMGILAFLFYKKRHHRHDDPFDSYVPPPQDFNIEFPPTMFPDNNDHNKGNHIDNSSGLQQGSVDPAPSYPPAKPHQVFPTTKPHEDVPARPSTVKPLGSD